MAPNSGGSKKATTVKNTLIKQGIKKNSFQKPGAYVVRKSADTKSQLHKSSSETSISSHKSITSHAGGLISDGCTPERLSGSLVVIVI